MKHIWSPWRMEFIKGPKEPTCVFCGSLQAKTDREKLVLWRGRHSFVIMNKYPYTTGHLLILPNRHTAEFSDLDSDTYVELMRIMTASIAILRDVVGCDGMNGGFNLGRSAGAGIPDHVHFHLVPRWNGDSNFMPVLAETRLMPEYLHQTYDRLRPLFEKRGDL